MQSRAKVKEIEGGKKLFEACRGCKASAGLIEDLLVLVAKGEIPPDCLMRFGTTLRVNRQKVLEAGIRNAEEYLKKMRSELSGAGGDQA